LEENIIEDDGAREIAKLCKELFSLTNLNLRSNRIHNKGIVALAKMLKTNRTLKNLNLESNEVEGDEGWKMMAQIVQRRPTGTEIMISCGSNYIAKELEVTLLRSRTSLFG